MDERCDECGAYIPEENLEITKQTHHLSGRPNATENLVTGYECLECGYYESW